MKRARFGFFTRTYSADWRLGATPEAFSLISALRIAGIYLALGALWIFFSDLIVNAVVRDPAIRIAVSIVKQAEYCSMMRNSSKILLGIINDVPDFSKIEAGKLELNEAPYSIRSLLNRIKSILFPLVEGKGLSLEIAVDPAIPDRLVGDELRQVHEARFFKISIACVPTEGEA